MLPTPHTENLVRDDGFAVLAIGAVAVLGICVSIIGLVTGGDANAVTKAAYALSLAAGTVTLIAVTVGYTSRAPRRKPVATTVDEAELWEHQLESLAEMGERLLMRQGEPDTEPQTSESMRCISSRSAAR